MIKRLKSQTFFLRKHFWNRLKANFRNVSAWIENILILLTCHIKISLTAKVIVWEFSSFFFPKIFWKFEESVIYREVEKLFYIYISFVFNKFNRLVLKKKTWHKQGQSIDCMNALRKRHADNTHRHLRIVTIRRLNSFFTSSHIRNKTTLRAKSTTG